MKTTKKGSPSTLAKDRQEAESKGMKYVPVDSETFPRSVTTLEIVVTAEKVGKYTVVRVPDPYADVNLSAVRDLVSNTETGQAKTTKLGSVDAAISWYAVRGMKGDFQNTARARIARKLSDAKQLMDALKTAKQSGKLVGDLKTKAIELLSALKLDAETIASLTE